MIKFFRNMRRQLLTQIKLSKYLLYALGEIILVVVGILIALQLNNMNEYKRERIREASYLSEIRSNLADNLEKDINPGIKNISRAVISFDTMRVALEDPSFNRETSAVIKYLWNITNPVDIVLNTVGFDNLSASQIDLISSDSLTKSITTLYGFHYKHLTDLDDAQHVFTRERVWPMIQNNIDFSNLRITAGEMEFLQTNGPLYSSLYGNNEDLLGTLRKLQFLKPIIEELISDIDLHLLKIEQ